MDMNEHTEALSAAIDAAFAYQKAVVARAPASERIALKRAALMASAYAERLRPSR